MCAVARQPRARTLFPAFVVPHHNALLLQAPRQLVQGRINVRHFGVVCFHSPIGRQVACVPRTEQELSHKDPSHAPAAQHQLCEVCGDMHIVRSRLS